MVELLVPITSLEVRHDWHTVGGSGIANEYLLLENSSNKASHDEFV